jgi:cytochrome c553
LSELVNLRRLTCGFVLSGVRPSRLSHSRRPFPRNKAIDSIEARVQGCVTCHGQSGQGTNNGYFPGIAGKPAAYLYNQLVAFRDGVRQYPPMNYLVAYLPDAYLREMAEHFSKLRPRTRRGGATADANAMARARRSRRAAIRRSRFPLASRATGHRSPE